MVILLNGFKPQPIPTERGDNLKKPRLDKQGVVKLYENTINF
jgi:hypothetical protein